MFILILIIVGDSVKMDTPPLAQNCATYLSMFYMLFYGNIFKTGQLDFLFYIVTCPGKYFAPAEVRHERLSKYL